MRTRVLLRRRDGTDSAVVVTTDIGTTTRAVARALLRADPGLAPRADDERPVEPVLRVRAPGVEEPRTLPPEATMLESGVRAGSTIVLGTELSTEGGAPDGSPPSARLVVISGPDVGREVDLPTGTSTVGRAPGSTVRLRDPMVSKLHARITVGTSIEIADAGSSNGVLIGDGPVTRAVLGPSDVVLLGDTELQVRPTSEPAGAAAAARTVLFARSPAVRTTYSDRTVEAPQVPGPAKPQGFPLLPMVAPLVMGVAMFAMTRNPLSVVFVALSPLMMLGTWLQRGLTERRRVRDQGVALRTGMRLLAEQIAAAHAEEVRVRLAEHPSCAEAVDAAMQLTPETWSLRPDRPGFLAVRLGTGEDRSRTTIEVPARGNADPLLWEEQRAALAGMGTVAGVPLVADLRACGVLGVAGTGGLAQGVARALVAQVVARHSPAELVLAAVASAQSSTRWRWLTWLPHVASPQSPLSAHLGASPAACAAVVAAIEELVADRSAQQSRSGVLPAVLLLVEDDCPVDRGRLVRLAEEGPAVGVHVLWCAVGPGRLPAACTTFLTLGADRARLGLTTEGEWRDLTCESLEVGTALDLARHLSGVVDAGASVVDESDLPRSVGYLGLLGREVAQDPAAVAELWRETGSVLDRSGAPPVRRRSDAALRAVVGQGAQGEFVLDLRAQGPHALVGGTTGSGKSEFLQAWVLGLAAAHSPDRVSFLFVDYKGGAAFADCVDLPHCVGLVTDLSPHLVRRALASLRAELRRREHLLNLVGAKDLLAMERAGDPRPPPALVIVVDEFAALVQEVPEFVDGVVDVAQRGRSLGLHLILATQRPAGVIKDNLRANTNLRVALRMADEADSTDVLGSPVAAQLDPRVPGRGAVRTGPGRLAMFQTGYVGGRSDEVPPPVIGIESLTFGPGDPWYVPVDGASPAPSDGPTDAARLVATIRAAADLAEVPPPSRPWLPELPLALPLDVEGGHDDGALPLGLRDVPAEQRQVPFVYRPDRDGACVVFGTSGSGKSAFLRSLAVSAAAAQGHVRVYAVDFAGGALSMLEELAQVGSVVAGPDEERVVRLLGDLAAELDARASRFAAARAATVGEYRTLTGADEPRVLLLVDGIGAMREVFERDPASLRVLAGLTRLIAEGRPLGVHVVLAAERPNALTAAMAASVPTRLVLRQTDENAAAQLGVPRSTLGEDTPAGRGVLAGSSEEVQIAVPGGETEVAAQAAVVTVLAARLAAAGAPVAPTVRRLGTTIALADLPSAAGGHPVLGVADDTLEPVGFERAGTLLVAGMPGSGRTTTLATIGETLRRHDPRAPVHLLAAGRSVLLGRPWWDREAAGAVAVGDLVAELLPDLTRPADEVGTITLVIEGLADLVSSECELALTQAVRAARRSGHLVVAESETTTWTAMSSLLTDLRNGRRGLVLQPDQGDGMTLVRAPFPVMSRADFPVGRGVLVDRGRLRRVQVATGTPVGTDQDARAAGGRAGGE